VKIEGHYDSSADIAWLRLDGYDASKVVSEEVPGGLREVDASTGALVGFEYWRASRALPAELLAMLPPPAVPAAA